MYWDSTLRTTNVRWPLGTFLDPQTETGGWRHSSTGGAVGSNFGVYISAGYFVSMSVIVSYQGFDGVQHLERHWASAGASGCWG